jgi:MFS family permease
VIAATFVTLTLLYGAWYSYAVFLIALLQEFGWSRSLVAGAFSVFLLVHGCLGPVMGAAVRRVGPRRLILVGGGLLAAGLFLTAEVTAWWHLYLAFGLLTAVGVSLSGWVPSVVLVRGWFPDRVGTAIGIASMGVGMGITCMVPLAQFFIQEWGWRWSYRILAALILGWIIPGTFWLIQDPPPGIDEEKASAGTRPRPHWSLPAAARTGRFWILAGVLFTGTAVMQIFLVHQVAYLVDHGMAPMAAATIGGLVGLGGTLGKVGWGTLSDRIGRERTYSYAFGLTLAAIGLLTLAGRLPAGPLPYVYAIVMGLGYGVISPLHPASASDLFGGPGYSVIFGTLYLFICFGGAAGAWMAGAVFDRTGDYAAALWLGVALAILSPILLWIAAPRRPNPPPDAGWSEVRGQRTDVRRQG